MEIARDTLFLLNPGFADPAFPGKTFYCPYCAQIEGVLALFPDLAARLDVVRVDFPRPRPAVIALVGAENQSLPTLVLADDAPAGLETGEYRGVRLVKDTEAILKALSARHGVPEPHF
ncbi:MAG: hypothetical protein RLY86_3324 [Pseudomonadota bacterium]|jgi:hypothetical protein